MPYVKQPWTDNVTPVDSAHMTHIEDGIAAVETGRQGAISYGTTPPVSPVDGDLWCLPADATNGVMWLFRYRAGSVNAEKWEFIGGSPLTNYTEATIALSAGAWVGVGGVVMPRSGVYSVTVSCAFFCSTAGAVGVIGPGIGVGTSPWGPTGAGLVMTGANTTVSCAPNLISPAGVAGQTINLFANQSVAGNALRRSTSVVPLRVS